MSLEGTRPKPNNGINLEKGKKRKEYRANNKNTK
jgi:hypothetical protein